jgi:hypothetical protein
VRKGADKLKAALHQKQQGRLDGFFKATPKPEGSSVNPAKRKVGVGTEFFESSGNSATEI